MSRIALLIRSAQDDDFAELCELFEELDTHHRELRPDLFRKPPGLAREFAEISSLIIGPDSAIIVAADQAEGSIVGLATLVVRRIAEQGVKRAREFVEIDNLAVRRTLRRNGIGRALVDASMRWAFEHSFGGVELTVHAFNSDATAFYEGIGFTTTVRRMELKERLVLTQSRAGAA